MDLIQMTTTRKRNKLNNLNHIELLQQSTTTTTTTMLKPTQTTPLEARETSASSAGLSRSISSKRQQLQQRQNSSSFSKRQQTTGRTKRIILGAIILTLVCVIFNPMAEQRSEAKKIKEKKVLKSLVKGLIFKNLSTKKNFLPLPVPIPGKWQQILNTILDTGFMFGDKSSTSPNKKLMFSSSAANKLMALLGNSGSGSSPVVSSSSALASKLFSKDKPSFPTKNQFTTNNKIDLDKIKKYTRLTAAKYAGKLINNGNNNKKHFGLGAAESGTSASAVSAPAAAAAASSVLFGNQMSKKSSNPNSHHQQHQTNDYMVTLFNLAKLVQQLRELDHTKLFNLNKKSASSTAADFFNRKNMPPIVSMNINNKKSFMNKMNYIHKLTTDFNHRYRHNNNELPFLF